MRVRAKIAATATILLAAALALGACGSQGVGVAKTSPYYRGAVLFRDHCSGCHTLSVVGAQGSATSIKNRVKVNGPNFNIRKEDPEQVLYAIQNGGFSGAIMPENIVLGDDAKSIASSSPTIPGDRRRPAPPRRSRCRRNRTHAGLRAVLELKRIRDDPEGVTRGARAARRRR